jgi:hypothetical protein
MADKDFRVKNGIYVGTDAYISNSITHVNAISFETNGFSGGNLAWNTADGTLDIAIGYGDVVLQTGQETHYVVRNASGSTILNGTSVYCDGVTEGSGRLTANLMLGNGSISPVQYLGLATHNINNGVNGIVTYFGYVRDLDTRGTANTAISVGDENWSVGDKLYVHPTAPGKLTKVEPEAPNSKICVAVVIVRNQSAGKLFVRPTTNLSLDKLQDVAILDGILDGQSLVWVSANSRFENKSQTGDEANLYNTYTTLTANDYNSYITLTANIYNTFAYLDANTGGTDNNAWVNANDYSTLLAAQANDYATFLAASANDGATLLSARANDYSTFLAASSNDYATLLAAQSNDGATLLSAQANDYSTFLAASSNDYTTLLAAQANDGATLLSARANDYNTLLTAYSNDGATLATARGNDHATLLSARANDHTTFTTITANLYNTYVSLNANVGGGNTQIYVGNTLISNNAVIFEIGNGISLIGNATSKTITFNVGMSNVTSQEFTANGASNSFTLAKSVSNSHMILVSYNGLLQKPATYSISNTTLTLANTLPIEAGSDIEVRFFDFFDLPGTTSGGGYVFQGSVSGYTSGGGTPTPTRANTIDKFPFAANGNATDVGDLTVGRYRTTGQSSSVSGYTSGGSAPPFSNVIDKFPFATNSNATDVGDLTVGRYRTTGQSSSVSGYTSGGGTPTLSNVIDKFPFTTNANATDVGDLTVARGASAGQSSTTHGYNSGGFTGPAYSNVIDKFPFTTNTNAIDVGDLTQARGFTAGQSSDVSGYASGGGAPANSNVIDKFPFATDGNATDVGDLLTANFGPAAGQSSTTSGYVSGSQLPTISDVIQKFPFASNANATDVGDLTQSRFSGGGQQV